MNGGPAGQNRCWYSRPATIPAQSEWQHCVRDVVLSAATPSASMFNWFPHRTRSIGNGTRPTDKFHCQLVRIDSAGSKKGGGHCRVRSGRLGWAGWGKPPPREPCSCQSGQENSGPSDRECVSPSLSTMLIIAGVTGSALRTGTTPYSVHSAYAPRLRIPHPVYRSGCLGVAAWSNLDGRATMRMQRLRSTMHHSKREQTKHDSSRFRRFLFADALWGALCLD